MTVENYVKNQVVDALRRHNKSITQAWDQPGLRTDGMENAYNKIKMKLHTSDTQTECAWHSEIFLCMSFDTQINAFLSGK